MKIIEEAGNNLISYIKGELRYICNEYIIVENGGIGYQIYVPFSTISDLPEINKVVKVHTYMYVREDGISLYGFSTIDGLELFKKLISVSGIGPKVALGILSSYTADKIIGAVVSEDIKTLCKCPGIGKKTAQRLILDLKDKLKNQNSFIENLLINENFSDQQQIDDAILALVALGYTKSDALDAIKKVDCKGDSAEDIIKKCLKILVQ